MQSFIRKTALYDNHCAASKNMVDFCGFKLPLCYKEGVIKEHLHTRNEASVFDVSHMLQIVMKDDAIERVLESLTPSRFINTEIGLAKYTTLLNEKGGIIDDCIISKIDNNEYYAVLNAACAAKDLDWLKKNCGAVRIKIMEDRSLLAIQGPRAAETLQRVINQNIQDIKRFNIVRTKIEQDEAFISRIGYTGEDGFEISLRNENAVKLWNSLLNDGIAKPAGLGARDSLRIEAGYPLYGNDIDETVSPIEAGMSWIVKQYNCQGASRLRSDAAGGIKQKRVGIKVTESKKIPRTGDILMNSQNKQIGHITSGTFSPILQTAIAQAYITNLDYNKSDNISVTIRNDKIPCTIHPISFLTKQ